MELVKDYGDCYECGKEGDVVLFEGDADHYLCKDCLERALRLINGEDDE